MRRSIAVGLGAGLLWALADWAASGVARVPTVLVVAGAVGCGAAGLVVGGAAAALGRPRSAAGWVLAGAVLLEGLAIASKELAGGARSAGAALAVLSAAAALVLASRARARSTLAALVLVPSGALTGALVGALGARLGAGESAAGWAHLAGLVLPLAWLAVERLDRPRLALRVPVAIAVASGLVLAQRPPASPPRPAATDAPRAEPGAGPHVVLLVIDTLRADAVPGDGAIAAFARGGVEFRRCVSAAPWTLPAMGALLTGLYPSEHGAVTAATPLAADRTTLAEHIRAAGWTTAAFTGGAFVGPAHRLDQGYEVFDATAERGFGPFGHHVPIAWRVARNRWLPLRLLVRLADEQRGLAGVLDAALRWTRAEPRAPKHLLLHSYQVHDYYLYDPDTDDAVLRDGPPASARFAGRLSVHPGELQDAGADDLAHFRAVYDARVAAVERLFPRLVADVEAALGGDVLWIVTSDHGEGFDAELGRVHHGGRLQEDLLHVPLVMRGPGLPAGRVVEAPVRSVDVLPTVLELCGLPAPEGLAGESLVPALRGERPFPPLAYAEERAHGFELLAARIGSVKAVRMGGAIEHFDLALDPLERAPLGDARSEATRAELRAALDAFAERHPTRASAEVELDRTTLEHLRTLGYVE